MFEQELVNNLDFSAFLLGDGVVSLRLVEVFRQDFKDEWDNLF